MNKDEKATQQVNKILFLETIFYHTVRRAHRNDIYTQLNACCFSKLLDHSTF